MAIKRLKKFNLPKAFRLRYIIPLIISIAFGFGIFNWIGDFVKRSPYFRINQVEIVVIGRAPLSEKTARELLSVHKGRNIFDVDLGATKEYILSRYPEIRTLVINRSFPNKLVLNVRPRKPFAQLGVYSNFYLIDRDAVVLPGGRPLAYEGLAVITGVDPRLVLSSIGRKCEYIGLKRALRLLEVIHQLRFSQDHEVHMIDASDEKNLSLYIEGGIEIKIGGENFRERIGMLNKTFTVGKLNKNQIKYIDLRFGNVVIGPR